MKSRSLLMIAVVAAALATAGCTSGDEPAATSTASPESTAAPTPTEAEAPEDTSTPAPDSASYPTVDELQAALAAAGIDCDDFDADDTSTGTCGNDFTLQVFADAAARDEVVNAEQSQSDPTPMAVGANWIVTAGTASDVSDVIDVTEALGGFAVPVGS